MSANRRGALIFLVLLVALVLCSLLTFSWLPGLGTAAALPVIMVPGEPLNGAVPSDAFHLTNTLVATLIADALVLLFAIWAWHKSRGWSKEVPGRFQSLAELLGGFIYGQTKGFAGARPLARNWLFPLAASIFVFLLAANWMDLLPGVESVGGMHCAHGGKSGYPSIVIGNNAEQLFSDTALNAGKTATEADYEACEHYRHTGARPDAAALNAAADHLFNEEGALQKTLAADTTLTQAEKDQRIDDLRLEATEALYPHAAFALTSDQLRRGAQPYVFAVTPAVRGASTDLNLTIGLALISVIAIQAFGVAAQGPAYFQKFINLHALGTIQKKPLGAIDFIVGLFEIISELGKIISLAFRLFGNMFAGAILLAVMSFLVAALLPMVFYGLELIVTSIQAYVFAILTIVFCAQAMEGHASDDHEHEEHGAHDGVAVEEDHSSEPITRTAI